MLLRRLELHNQKGRKLEPRWEGPYILEKVMYHQRSGILNSLRENNLVGKYHLNDMKKFVGRSDRTEETDQRWRTMAKDAQDQGEQLEKIIEKQNEKGTEGIGTDDQAPEWWDDFIVYPDDADDKQDPAYWSTKAVTLREDNFRSFGG